MNTSEARSSIKSVIAETFSLNPSALLSFYEISVENLGLNLNEVSQSEIDSGKNVIFRFHNNISLYTNSLMWQGREYSAAPIFADGFEINARGSPTSPRLSITVSDEGVPQLARLKDRLRELGDIVGAKVTRIRTFARFLDASNFINGIPPQNFYPDPLSELSRDIYYIDRKSNENKNIIEYELSPIFEIEGVKLPGRIVSQDNCFFTYRGCGCLYEYAARKNTDVHEDGVLPDFAPPVATNFNEPINTLITGVAFTDKAKYNFNQIYNKGDFIYLENRGIKSYFVSKVDNNTSPPPSNSWVSDECNHKCGGCRLRWAQIGDGNLRFGGFPSVNRFR